MFFMFICLSKIRFLFAGRLISYTTYKIILNLCYCDKHYDHTSLIEGSFGPTQPEINCVLPLIYIHPQKNY